MKRRALLNWLVKTSVLSIAAVNLPVSVAVGSTQKQTGRCFDFSPETDQLGRQYLSLHPDDAPVCRQLLKKLSDGKIGLANTDSQMWRVLSQKIRDDFHQNHTVIMHGWVLSRTELRLATLNVL